MIGMETADRFLGTGRYEIHTRNGQRYLQANWGFRQGETILYLPGRFQSEPDKFSIEIEPEVHINCSDSFAGAINHSCVPNAAVKDFRIVAWACIKAGDEITIDYKRTESKLAEPFDCQCGHQLCIGRVE